MRYIDADALIEMLNNKAKTDLEMGLYNHHALTESFIRFVERQPTADVAPKSEVIDEFVERLKEQPIKCCVPLLGLSTKEEVLDYFNDIMLQVRDAMDKTVKEMIGGAE